jgi:hypothetical protein
MELLHTFLPTRETPGLGPIPIFQTVSPGTSVNKGAGALPPRKPWLAPCPLHLKGRLDLILQDFPVGVGLRHRRGSLGGFPRDLRDDTARPDFRVRGLLVSVALYVGVSLLTGAPERKAVEFMDYLRGALREKGAVQPFASYAKGLTVPDSACTPHQLSPPARQDWA